MLLIVEECECHGCERDVDMTRENDGDPYGQSADARFCSDDCADVANEAAYERQLSDYYGGAGPVTIDEMCAAGRAQKEGRS